MLRRYVLPPVIAVVYWLWSHTWRFRVVEHPEFQRARTEGRPIVFAHWHGDEMVVLRLGPRYKCAAMTSTSEDGELMTRVLRLFGFGISRGSSTRGGARALVGIVKLVRDGFSGTVAIDGPKGPRHKPKPGVWHLARHAEALVIPTGVARSSAVVFERSWNKTFLPKPFAKVIVSFGAPLAPPAEITEQNTPELLALLEEKMHLQRGHAQALINCGTAQLNAAQH